MAYLIHVTTDDGDSVLSLSVDDLTDEQLAAIKTAAGPSKANTLKVGPTVQDGSKFYTWISQWDATLNAYRDVVTIPGDTSEESARAAAAYVAGR